MVDKVITEIKCIAGLVIFDKLGWEFSKILKSKFWNIWAMWLAKDMNLPWILAADNQQTRVLIEVSHRPP